MPLRMEVGLGPGDIVLDGSPAPPKGGTTAPPTLFDPCLLWPYGWMDQDTTCCGGRPQSRRHCVRWGTQLPHEKKAQQPPLFSTVSCGQTAGWINYTTWYGGRPHPGYIVSDGDLAAPTERGTAGQGPHFSAHFALKRLSISATAELSLFRAYVTSCIPLSWSNFIKFRACKTK